MRSVLVGSDLGPGSDEIVRGAAALAFRSGASLHVVHALELIGRPLREAVAALEGCVAGQARDTLQGQLDRVLAGCASAAISTVDYRSADRAILGQANASGADLIVLGARPRAGAGEHQSGVAVTVAEQGALPVLVLRGALHWPPRSVLLPVEEPHAPAESLRTACDWLHEASPASSTNVAEPRTDLLVLHAAGVRDAAPDRAAALTRAARRAGGATMRITGIHDPRHGRSPASPADHILDWAERVAPDLIVLSRRDDGSVPLPEQTWYEVLVRARCPVCLLPRPTTAPAGPAEAGPERVCTLPDGAELTVGT